MRFVNLLGVLLALAFALCLFACDDTVSSTDTSETNGLDAIPGFNIKPYSSGKGETSSSGGSSSSFEESSASEESSSSVEEESSSSEESNSVSSEESSSSKRSSSSSEENSSSGESSSSLEDSSSSEESSSSEDSSSSSSEDLSSSSISVQNPGTDIGTCGPEKDVVERDETVMWKFTRGPEINTVQLINASFSWTFEGGTPATVQVKGASGNIQDVQYATSGDHSASLVVSMGASTYNLTCSPVHVNGDPITGCKCSTSAASVDYTSTPEVAWSVTGCVSASVPFTYNWDGTDGSDTFTKSFYAPTASYAPVLEVGNADNTVVDVTCTAVKVTDGPSYEIVATQNAGAIKLPAGTSTVTLKVDAYNNTVFCNVAREDSPTGALDGSVNNVAINGADYISVSMPAGTLVNGATLEFYLDVPATCGVQ